METIRDSITARAAGVPTVTISTEHFAPLAENLATRRGDPDLEIHQLPYPLEGLSDGEIATIADEHYVDVRARLGVM